MSIVIGICGGSGAGKTFLANLLKDHYQSRMVIIPFDAYCKDQSKLSKEERAKINYDCPDAYDGELLAIHLKELKEGKMVGIPQFDFPTHTRKKEKTNLKPAPIIVIEGIMAFSFPNVNRQLDYKIFVDASEEVRYQRRLNRDIVERGRTPDSVNKQFYSNLFVINLLFFHSYKTLKHPKFHDLNDEQ